MLPQIAGETKNINAKIINSMSNPPKHIMTKQSLSQECNTDLTLENQIKVIYLTEKIMKKSQKTNLTKFDSLHDKNKSSHALVGSSVG